MEEATLRTFLGISTAAMVALAAPVAFAAVIPVLTSEGLVSSGADFTYTTELSADQEIDTTHGSTNSLTLTGGALGPTTALVPNSETGFLTNFAFSTNANAITLTCPIGGACSTDISGDTSAQFTILSPATSTTPGSFSAQAIKNDPNADVDETPTTNSGRVSVPAAAVPEPASLAVFGAALAGLCMLRRRRHDA